MSRKDAAIVGIYEYPDRDVDGEFSALQIKTLCAQKALADAGLNWSDVDGLFDASEGAAMSGLLLAEYWGLNPTLIDTTGVGGSSYEFHAAHAGQGSSRIGHGTAAGTGDQDVDVTADFLGRGQGVEGGTFEFGVVVFCNDKRAHRESLK